MTYIKDLIDLPEQVRRGDFVLKLSEGLAKPAETVANYVVTEQLVKCFDEALLWFFDICREDPKKIARYGDGFVNKCNICFKNCTFHGKYQRTIIIN